VLLWANRIDVPVWVDNEFGAVRRSLVHQLFPFPFTAYAKSLPVKLHLAISYGGLLATRRRINRGTILLSVGLVLFLLDFLV